MRREFPRKIRAEAIKRANGKCQKCEAVLKPREAEVDHILPDVLGGEPVLANAMVLCKVCHTAKTGDDIRRTRKGDRQRDKASGAIKPKSKLSAKAKEPKLSRHPPLPRPSLYRTVTTP